MKYPPPPPAGRPQPGWQPPSSGPASPGWRPPPPGWHPGNRPAPPPSRTRRRWLLIVGCVAVGLIFAGSAAKPYYDEHQLLAAYEAMGGPSGFLGDFTDPKITEYPTRIEQSWNIDTRLPFTTEERAEKLYAWARNTGSTAPVQDFLACFTANCDISWVFQDDYRITIFGVWVANPSPLLFVIKPI